MDNADQHPASGTWNHAVNQWVPPPKALQGFPDAKPAKPKTQFAGGMRRRWKDSDGRIYEWDYDHGAVEIYDRRGNHIGEFDHVTKTRRKPADPTKRVEP
jgi:hypothetical protein